MKHLALLLGLLSAASLHAQTAPVQSVSVVAVGSMPRSVVKWDKDGQNEYVLAEPRALPPTNLHVRSAKEGGAKFEPFTLTLNVPSPVVQAPASGLPVYQGAENGAPATEAAPLLVVPVLNGAPRQLVFMFRDDPAHDWSKPEFLPLNLGDAVFPMGGVGFVNLSGSPVRVDLPQTKGAKGLANREFVPAKAPPGAATLNYRISIAGAGNKAETVAFTGLRTLPSQRQVVVIYKSNDKKTVCSSFAIPGE